MGTVSPDLVDKVLAARLLARSQVRYMDKALLNLYLAPNAAHTRTMAVSADWVCYWNPEFVAACSLQELAAVLVHEAMHCLRFHHARLPFSLTANMAADLEINDDIRDMGLSLPGNPLFPEQYNFPPGLTCEEYYALLEQQASPASGSSDMAPDADSANGRGNNGAQGQGQGSGTAQGPGDARDDATPSDNMPGQGEPLLPVQGEQAGGLPEHVRERVAMQVARDILDAAKQAGNVPGGLRRWAEGKLGKRVDVLRRLRALVSDIAQGGAEDYSYRRPRRHGRVLLPRLAGRQRRVAFVVDTSASMTEGELGVAVGIIEQALAHARVDVYVGDTQVEQTLRNVRRGQVADHLTGGGGTDMAAMLRTVARGRTRYDGVIVVTDGYTDWPSEPMPFDVVVVLTHPDTDTPPYPHVEVLP